MLQKKNQSLCNQNKPLAEHFFFSVWKSLFQNTMALLYKSECDAFQWEGLDKAAWMPGLYSDT